MASLKFKEVCCLAFSGLLFFSGLVLIGVASYLLFNIFYHYTFIPSGSVGPFFVIFLLGIVHLLVTWLGVKGPTREHNFHIVLFMLFTLILLACEFAVGVWSIILWDEIEVGSIDLMTQSFDELMSKNYHKKDWNKLQNQLRCCGVNGLGDYNKTDTYPASCFIISHNSSQGTTYKEGCKLPLIKYVKSILIDGAIIGFFCTIFQGLGIFTFFTFFKSLQKERAERIARRVVIQREMAYANAGDNHIQSTPFVMASVSPPRSGSTQSDQYSQRVSRSIPTTPPAPAQS